MIDVRRLLALILAEDPTAADEIDALAERLKLIAANLRAGQRSPMVSVEGLTDRVKMQVVGPDGIVNQQTDTHSRGNYVQHP